VIDDYPLHHHLERDDDVEEDGMIVMIHAVAVVVVIYESQHPWTTMLDPLIPSGDEDDPILDLFVASFRLEPFGSEQVVLIYFPNLPADPSW